MTGDKLKILVSSTVYASDSDLDQIKYSLEGFGYEVIMSKEGSVYVPIDDDPTEACLKAHQLVVFEGAAKSGVYRLTPLFFSEMSTKWVNTGHVSKNSLTCLGKGTHNMRPRVIFIYICS